MLLTPTQIYTFFTLFPQFPCTFFTLFQQFYLYFLDFFIVKNLYEVCCKNVANNYKSMKADPRQNFVLVYSQFCLGSILNKEQFKHSTNEKIVTGIHCSTLGKKTTAESTY